MKIAVDFDGTCVYHEYPKVGDPAPFAVASLRKLAEQGHKLILYTMRSGSTLDDAVSWFKDNEINLYSIQKDRGQESWTDSNKCYAQLYIDDAALGCPLTTHYTQDRQFVDWLKVMATIDLMLSNGGG